MDRLFEYHSWPLTLKKRFLQSDKNVSYEHLLLKRKWKPKVWIKFALFFLHEFRSWYWLTCSVTLSLLKLSLLLSREEKQTSVKHKRDTVTRFKYLANMFVVIKFQYVGLIPETQKWSTVCGINVSATFCSPKLSFHHWIKINDTHNLVEVVLIFSVVAFLRPST